MKCIFFLPLFITLTCVSQKIKVKTQIDRWSKAVVNIETEGYIYPQYYIDSILNSAYSSVTSHRYDSLKRALTASRIHTGTAIYIIDNSRKYLVTAKHVLFDKVIVEHKKYQTDNKIYDWSLDMDGIYLRISIRTPYSTFQKSKALNDLAIWNHNFVRNIKPYIFISENSGDGLAILSLQERNYKKLDTLLNLNGYIPIPLNQIINERNEFYVGDEIFTVGFPEMVSTVQTTEPSSSFQPQQLWDVVMPFTCFGKIATFDSTLAFYYVDLTITPGNSGGPIIRDNKLIGLVSGINKYSIVTDPDSQPLPQNMYGIGHLVGIMRTHKLKEYIKELAKKEDLPGFYK